MGLKPWSHVLFGRKLKERFKSVRKPTGVVYQGVGIRAIQDRGLAAIATAKVGM